MRVYTCTSEFFKMHIYPYIILIYFHFTHPEIFYLHLNPNPSDSNQFQFTHFIIQISLSNSEISTSLSGAAATSVLLSIFCLKNQWTINKVINLKNSFFRVLWFFYITLIVGWLIMQLGLLWIYSCCEIIVFFFFLNSKSGILCYTFCLMMAVALGKPGGCVCVSNPQLWVFCMWII